MNVVTTTFVVGPVRVTVEPTLPAFERRIEEQLQIFNTDWDHQSTYEVRLRVHPWPTRAPAARGTHLTCSRMDVDTTGDGLYATTLCGASALLDQTWDGGEAWTIGFPDGDIDSPAIDQLEDLVGLALVSGWRAAGWTPVHGGAVTKDDKCLLLCAMSGGGKSTLTAALVRDGWRTLGDDKLLLRVGSDGVPEVAALLHSFNLHPQTRDWFPEVGDLELLPRYSAWTVKRKVYAGDVWPGRTAQRARPTHILRVRRDLREVPIEIAPLAADEMFRTLVGQIAIPNDTAIAAKAMRTVAATMASGLRGLDVVIGEGAYRDPATLERLTAAL
jgi:hypothetical protein